MERKSPILPTPGQKHTKQFLSLLVNINIREISLLLLSPLALVEHIVGAGEAGAVITGVICDNGSPPDEEILGELITAGTEKH